MNVSSVLMNTAYVFSVDKKKQKKKQKSCDRINKNIAISTQLGFSLDGIFLDR